ncbi:hypothetical protein [Streptomyces halobius]|uniref:ATP-binding protein n=1 Tax=Streptomyces halobius TaxID=2879846 RepID=A0ABY4M919_9ACTN|nr:hypothetical protein [Streptomyces halobius]UQA93269.1 hypothetical protein K9S39_16730 [Streptomyces halobius]
MSHPVTRRIARAALLIAAGAAPVVGAAGSANALSVPPKAPVGGLDADGTNQKVDDVAETGVGMANTLGHQTASELAPATVNTVVPTVVAAQPLVYGRDGTTGILVREDVKGGHKSGKSGHKGSTKSTAKAATRTAMKTAHDAARKAGKTARHAPAMAKNAAQSQMPGHGLIGGLPLTPPGMFGN